MKDFQNKTVGEIVSQNIEYARIFESLGIDFCCGGDILLKEAAIKASIPLERVMDELKTNAANSTLPEALNFNAWSLDLLIDYVVKFHHVYIRTNGPKIYHLLEKVVNAHGETDRHLYEVFELFKAALIDLGSHLEKEENILFPLVHEILNASAQGKALPQFHCGSVCNPIRVMMQEHDDEGARFKRISELTNSYTAPEYACNSYKLVLDELKQFEANLHIHIHVENNILFTKSIAIEDSLTH